MPLYSTTSFSGPTSSARTARRPFILIFPAVISLLHLVKPIGFELDDRHVRRSGMDYWRKIEYRIHENWQDFLSAKGDAPMYLYSTKAEKNYWDAPMEDGSYLVFGSEGHGLPQEIHDAFEPYFYTIPMPGNFSRSLNLANSTAVVIYEGLRRRFLKG